MGIIAHNATFCVDIVKVLLRMIAHIAVELLQHHFQFILKLLEIVLVFQGDITIQQLLNVNYAKLTVMIALAHQTQIAIHANLRRYSSHLRNA